MDKAFFNSNSLRVLPRQRRLVGKARQPTSRRGRAGQGEARRFATRLCLMAKGYAFCWISVVMVTFVAMLMLVLVFVLVLVLVLVVVLAVAMACVAVACVRVIVVFV